MEKLEELKSELIGVLAPIFGQGIKNILENYYDKKEAGEMMNLADHMLTGYLGAKSAHLLIKKISAKYHLI